MSVEKGFRISFWRIGRVLILVKFSAVDKLPTGIVLSYLSSMELAGRIRFFRPVQPVSFNYIHRNTLTKDN